MNKMSFYRFLFSTINLIIFVVLTTKKSRSKAPKKRLNFQSWDLMQLKITTNYDARKAIRRNKDITKRQNTIHQKTIMLEKKKKKRKEKKKKEERKKKKKEKKV